MGLCYGKASACRRACAGACAGAGRSTNDGEATASDHPPPPSNGEAPPEITPVKITAPAAPPQPSGDVATATAWPSPFASHCGSPSQSPLPPGVSPSPVRASLTPRRLFRRPFPPPSPAKHIKASLAKRFGFQTAAKPKETSIPEDAPAEPGETEARQLDKNFGFGKNFGAKYELGKEVGRGHFGHTCAATVRKGEHKGATLAVKIISKAKMTTPISIEDVRREVNILKALSGHANLVKFYDACEDALNVYIVMELCEGGELLDRILSRGGRYSEEDAKHIVVQVLSVVAFCHLQGIVHRDLKPENFLFISRDDSAPMKLIDFGLSDFVRPDERLNDIVGSAYYVAPEVLHRSYSTEADVWSIGVIIYILLCGSRPFWARTESGIFRSVLKSDPNFDDSPWPTVSPQAKDLVKRFLNKDYRKRMSPVQALTHPWLRDGHPQIPLDIFIFRLVKQYLRATPLRRLALVALSKALTEDELLYLRLQFSLLDLNNSGHVSLENFRAALMQSSTEVMKESRMSDILNSLEPMADRKMDFAEFCAAAISPYQLEALERWEEIAATAFQHFEREGNRAISIEQLVEELNIPATSFSIVEDWIRKSDGKLNLLGYTKFLHGVTVRSNTRRQ